MEKYIHTIITSRPRWISFLRTKMFWWRYLSISWNSMPSFSLFRFTKNHLECFWYPITAFCFWIEIHFFLLNIKLHSIYCNDINTGIMNNYPNALITWAYLCNFLATSFKRNAMSREYITLECPWMCILTSKAFYLSLWNLHKTLYISRNKSE